MLNKQGISYFIPHLSIWETYDLKTCANHQFGDRGHNLHVRLHLFATDGSDYGFTSGPPAANYCRYARPQRGAHQSLPSSAKPFLIEDALVAGYLWRGAGLEEHNRSSILGGRQIKTWEWSSDRKVGEIGLEDVLLNSHPKAIICICHWISFRLGTVILVVLQGRKGRGLQYIRDTFSWRNEGSAQRQESILNSMKLPTPGLSSCALFDESYCHSWYKRSFGRGGCAPRTGSSGASILVSFTSALRLWAADMEKGNFTAQGTAPNLGRLRQKRSERFFGKYHFVQNAWFGGVSSCPITMRDSNWMGRILYYTSTAYAACPHGSWSFRIWVRSDMGCT